MGGKTQILLLLYILGVEKICVRIAEVVVHFAVLIAVVHITLVYVVYKFLVVSFLFIQLLIISDFE